MSEECSGRVLDLRLEGHWFEIHRRHSVVSLSKTLYPLRSTGSIQEDRKHPDMTERFVDGDVKHQHKQITKLPVILSKEKQHLLHYIVLFVCLFVFVALRPMSTAMVIAEWSVHLTTLFPGQA